MLYSVTKQQQKQQPQKQRQQQQQQQQQQQCEYDYVLTNPLVTGVCNHQVKNSFSSNSDNIVMNVNPTISDLANNSGRNNEDTGWENEVMESQSRQMKTDDIKVMTNPAYVEAKFK